jgi:hypothetical protein
VAEVLVEFPAVIIGKNKVRYHAHVCGASMTDGKWQGWLEFVPVDGGSAIRSGRETTQPNRTDAVYWATGLTAVYLEGGLQRALNPLVVRHFETDTPVFEEPASTVHQNVEPPIAQDAVLDPVAIYENEGEALLRRRLAALAAWHLANIIEKYELSDEPPTVVNRLPAAALIERIVSAVRSYRTRATRHV